MAYTKPFKSTQIHSYPAPMAPFFWSVLEIFKDGEKNIYRQGFTQLLNPKKSRLMGPSEGVEADFTCVKNQMQQIMLNHYIKWGTHVDCESYVYKGREGCRCVSMKYSYLRYNFATFGTFFIDEEGKGEFMPHDNYSLIFKKSKDLVDE